MGENHAKQCFTFFAVLHTYYRRFRLSRVSQRIDLERIYRLVLEILHFMPCGSALENLSSIYQTLIEIQSKLYRNSIGI